MSMLPEHIKSLRSLLETFPTQESCLEYLELRRWNGHVTSPFVKNGIAYKSKSGKYICKRTRKYFNVRTGTIFEKTKVPLRDWFIAFWHITSYKKGISSVALAKELGVTQATAWYMAQKIRRYFSMSIEDELAENEKMTGIFSLDEMCVGGLQANRHKDKKIPNSQGGHGIDKTWVLGLNQRKGKLLTFVMPFRDGEFAKKTIRKYIAPGSVLISDAWKGYCGLDEDYHHYVVKDGNKSNRNYNPEIHTNDIEGAWATFKRGYNGIYNWWSKQHMKFYLSEFTFRRNTRQMKDSERFCLFLGNIFERVTYNDIRNATWN